MNQNGSNNDDPRAGEAASTSSHLGLQGAALSVGPLYPASAALEIHRLTCAPPPWTESLFGSVPGPCWSDM
jgi:hypothetical protein